MDIRKALNRVTYGPTEELIKEVENLGWPAWVKQQLALESDEACDTLIKNLNYDLEFEDDYRDKKRNHYLFCYYKSAQELFDMVDGGNNEDQGLIMAPSVETALITQIKAIHSKNQIFEMLVEFWHNHFNVSIQTQEEITVLFPVYDREVIRANALGNFRKFTEAVAKSPCMLVYLDNAYSRASPANENYARELFELHTLGAMHYYNHLYDDWKEVPGAKEGKAEGYIDEDVYEAARAFTGWTVGLGQETEEVQFPGTGGFYYYDQWHDHYQKRILGHEFKSHQEAMSDGMKVLDLVCYHPGTAKHLCWKLCKFFVSNEPSESLVEQAAKIWKDNEKSDDQILKVVEFILTSVDFEQNLGTKVKRPNHLLTSLVRQLDMKVQPTLDWSYVLMELGWKQFSWPLPTGHPDENEYWLNTDMLLKRWNILPILFYFNMENSDDRFFSKQLENLPDTKLDTIIDHWSRKLTGGPQQSAIKEQIKDEVLVDMENMRNQEWMLLADEYPEGLEYKLMQTVALIALSPEMHKR